MVQDVFGIVGSVIADSYEIEAPVAEGGFAVVYRAHHRAFRAKVALKCLKLNPSLAEYGRKLFLEQFRAEAEILYQLSARLHEVVRPLHVDALTTKSGQFVPFLVLEWLDGDTLDVWVRKRTATGTRPLGIRRLVRLLTPVARALDTAHHFVGSRGASRVVHCDMKPHNVVMARAGNDELPKILDFGIARVRRFAEPLGAGEKVPHSFTPRYASPEQWLPKRYGSFGPWTDVWGLALTLVELLLPSSSLVGDAMSMALDPKQRPTPRAFGVEIPEPAERVLTQALAIDPQARYRDVASFWDELLQALELEPGVATGTLPRDQRREAGRVIQVERLETSALQVPAARPETAQHPREVPAAMNPSLPRAPFPFLSVHPAPIAAGAQPVGQLVRDTHRELASALRPRRNDDVRIQPIEIPRAASLPRDLFAALHEATARESAAPAANTIPTPGLPAEEITEELHLRIDRCASEVVPAGLDSILLESGTHFQSPNTHPSWASALAATSSAPPDENQAPPNCTAAPLDRAVRDDGAVHGYMVARNYHAPAGGQQAGWVRRAGLVLMCAVLALLGGYIGARFGQP
ncbi:MAG TPA: protein kinase [Polyangiaceae bacterium]|nr:protein kinase [Polyangiaceae bacterium]